MKAATTKSVMKTIKYCIYKETPYYVAQCLNVDVSSFGQTVEEAAANLKEAVELYFEDAPEDAFRPIDDVVVGEERVYA
jgi:predicted RNase H-like HicB family nuclease